MTRRLLTPLLASALALLAAPSAAQAGSYDVLACDAAPNGANGTWSFENNATATLQSLSACPSTAPYSGLVARTILGGAAPSTGARAQWVFRAPTGTTITRVRLDRWLGMEGGSGWRPFGRQADGTILSGETCSVPSGSYECNVGGYNTATSDHTVDTTSVAYGIECIGSGGCTTGSSIHDARAAIYSARVTLSESTAPSVGTPTGALVTEAGYHRGTESASFTGSDTTGIKALRVYVSGTERASQALACDYTEAIPCDNPTAAQTLGVNLSATNGGIRVIPDGTHSVQVAVVDAASNETRSTARSIVVDATAPAPPRNLAGSIGSNWQASRDFTATWTHPTGQVAPIVTAHWSFCPQGSTSGCVAGSAPVSASTGSLSDLLVPGEGAWDFTVRLQDAAGNTAVTNVARTTVRYDATAPAASPNLGVASRAETTQAFQAYFNPPSGQHAPVTEALWTLCPQGSSSGCTSGSMGTDPYSTNYLRSSIPSHGDWTLTVRLRDQAGNLGAPATTHLRYAASVPAPTAIPQPAVTPIPSSGQIRAAAPRASAKLRVTSAVLDRSSRTLVVKGRTATSVRGAVRVRVTATRSGRTSSITRTARIRAGQFKVRLRLSRLDHRGRLRVSTSYGGSATHTPDRTAPARVRAR